MKYISSPRQHRVTAQTEKRGPEAPGASLPLCQRKTLGKLKKQVLKRSPTQGDTGGASARHASEEVLSDKDDTHDIFTRKNVLWEQTGDGAKKPKLGGILYCCF